MVIDRVVINHPFSLRCTKIYEENKNEFKNSPNTRQKDKHYLLNKRLASYGHKENVKFYPTMAKFCND
ncbi:MAG: hypothetical protein A2X86_11255 [Bdellovibrionales bacterium GWA2_49_15]|nr:MAG: hypothetical protein A2X86_11255 [Bdellovibrionales bacterium GWA2_49_15]